MDLKYRLQSKRIERNVLEEELEADELWDCERYQRLQQQIEALKAELDETSDREADSVPTPSGPTGTD